MWRYPINVCEAAIDGLTPTAHLANRPRAKP
jgi:hypothetical protein